MRAGYHKVFLEDYGIEAELTSTMRVGFHRYTFLQTDTGYIHFDFTTTLGPSKTDYGYARRVSDQEISGYAVMASTVRRPKPVKVFFVATFDKPFSSFRGWKGKEQISDTEVVEGPGTGVYLRFNDVGRKIIQMKVAISYVSEDNARLNLATELPHWDFDRTAEEARHEKIRLLPDTPDATGY